MDDVMNPEVRAHELAEITEDDYAFFILNVMSLHDDQHKVAPAA